MNNRKPSIEIYLSDEQKVTIKKAAADTRSSISEYCLQMIFKGSVISALKPEEIQMMGSLAGMANNLNQVVKRMHQDKSSDQRVTEVIEMIKKIEALLR